MAKAESLWPANDALCAALQVINHLQDCAKDYRELDRVYIPEPLLAAGIGGGGAGRKQGQSGPGGVIVGPGAPECRAAGDFASLRPGDPRWPAGAGSRSHPDPRRRSQRHADPTAIRCPNLCIIPRWMWRPCSSKRFPAFALMRLTTRQTDDQRRKYRRARAAKAVQEKSQRQFLLYRHAADAGGGARRHVRDLCLLPQGGRYRR